MKAIDLLSSDSDDSDAHGHSVKQVYLYNSFIEDHISIIDPTTDTDNDDTLLSQINLEASHPEFYLSGINTDKPGEVIEN